MFPKRIYLCGGSMNTFCHFGALKHLEEKGYLRFVKEWMGTSAGAMQALGLALGYTLTELITFNTKLNFQELMEPDEASGWIANLGFDTGNRLIKLMNAFLKEKGLKETLTFQELYALAGRSFRTFATNINTGEFVIYSKELTPDYCVTHAVRASMSLPYFFQPFQCPKTGHLLCDGGIINNYPLIHLTEEERQETLGFLLQVIMQPLKNVDISDMMLRPLGIFVQASFNLAAEHYPNQTLLIRMPKTYAADFSMDAERKQELMDMGVQAAKEFLKKWRLPVRRYSVS